MSLYRLTSLLRVDPSSLLDWNTIGTVSIAKWRSLAPELLVGGHNMAVTAGVFVNAVVLFQASCIAASTAPGQNQTTLASIKLMLRYKMVGLLRELLLMVSVKFIIRPH